MGAGAVRARVCGARILIIAVSRNTRGWTKTALIRGLRVDVDVNVFCGNRSLEGRALTNLQGAVGHDEQRIERVVVAVSGSLWSLAELPTGAILARCFQSNVASDQCR